MLPWGQMLRIAQYTLALSPSQFWSLSILEWRYVQSQHADHANRTTLQSLMAQHPDTRTGKKNEDTQYAARQ